VQAITPRLPIPALFLQTRLRNLSGFKYRRQRSLDQRPIFRAGVVAAALLVLAGHTLVGASCFVKGSPWYCRNCTPASGGARCRSWRSGIYTF